MIVAETNNSAQHEETTTNVATLIAQRNTEADGGIPIIGARIVLVATAIVFIRQATATQCVPITTLTVTTVEATGRRSIPTFILKLIMFTATSDTLK